MRVEVGAERVRGLRRDKNIQPPNSLRRPSPRNLEELLVALGIPVSALITRAPRDHAP